MLEQLKSVFNQFRHNSEYASFSELASGHINDTFLIKTTQKPYFVLQRINHGVFKDIPGLIANKVNISNHLIQKLSHLPKKELQRKVLHFVSTINNEWFYKDESGNFWNLMVFIDNSLTHETVKDEKIAYEGAKLVGDFLNLTSEFDATRLIEVIPKFHDMSYRFWQFEEALKKASEVRKEHAKDCIAKVAELKNEMHIIQHLKESGKIPIRVTHNDTKISNALFDAKSGQGLCLIDLDTIMPGIVHYDFGDAIRTICNTAGEDEKDLDKVNFNLKYYNAYTKGFLEEMKTSLTSTEIKYLPLGAKTMIFIMAIRFLTDFLNNDVYYKITYPTHNLDRAKNQFKLIESMDECFNEL